jgi:hypothetical protein
MSNMLLSGDEEKFDESIALWCTILFERLIRLLGCVGVLVFSFLSFEKVV